MRIHFTFPPEFFMEKALDVEVGMPDVLPVAEHDPEVMRDDETWVEAP